MTIFSPRSSTCHSILLSDYTYVSCCLIIIIRSCRAIDIELNSSAVARAEDGTVVASFNSFEPTLAVQSMEAALSTLLQASGERVAALEMVAKTAAPGQISASVSDAVAGLSLADRSDLASGDKIASAWSLIQGYA